MVFLFNLKDLVVYAYSLICVHYDVMWFIFLILGVVYWTLYKILKDFNWHVINKQAGLFKTYFCSYWLKFFIYILEIFSKDKSKVAILARYKFYRKIWRSVVYRFKVFFGYIECDYEFWCKVRSFIILFIFVYFIFGITITIYFTGIYFFNIFLFDFIKLYLGLTFISTFKTLFFEIDYKVLFFLFNWSRYRYTEVKRFLRTLFKTFCYSFLIIVINIAFFSEPASVIAIFLPISIPYFENSLHINRKFISKYRLWFTFFGRIFGCKNSILFSKYIRRIWFRNGLFSRLNIIRNDYYIKTFCKKQGASDKKAVAWFFSFLENFDIMLVSKYDFIKTFAEDFEADVANDLYVFMSKEWMRIKNIIRHMEIINSSSYKISEEELANLNAKYLSELYEFFDGFFCISGRAKGFRYIHLILATTFFLTTKAFLLRLWAHLTGGGDPFSDPSFILEPPDEVYINDEFFDNLFVNLEIPLTNPNEADFSTFNKIRDWCGTHFGDYDTDKIRMENENKYNTMFYAQWLEKTIWAQQDLFKINQKILIFDQSFFDFCHYFFVYKCGVSPLAVTEIISNIQNGVYNVNNFRELSEIYAKGSTGIRGRLPGDFISDFKGDLALFSSEFNSITNSIKYASLKDVMMHAKINKFDNHFAKSFHNLLLSLYDGSDRLNRITLLFDLMIKYKEFHLESEVGHLWENTSKNVELLLDTQTGTSKARNLIWDKLMDGYLYCDAFLNAKDVSREYVHYIISSPNEMVFVNARMKLFDKLNIFYAMHPEILQSSGGIWMKILCRNPSMFINLLGEGYFPNIMLKSDFEWLIMNYWCMLDMEQFSSLKNLQSFRIKQMIRAPEFLELVNRVILGIDKESLLQVLKQMEPKYIASLLKDEDVFAILKDIPYEFRVFFEFNSKECLTSASFNKLCGLDLLHKHSLLLEDKACAGTTLNLNEKSYALYSFLKYSHYYYYKVNVINGMIFESRNLNYMEHIDYLLRLDPNENPGMRLIEQAASIELPTYHVYDDKNYFLRAKSYTDFFTNYNVAAEADKRIMFHSVYTVNDGKTLTRYFEPVWF